jgi:hypothetical protein
MTDQVLLFALPAVGAAGEAPVGEAEMGARFGQGLFGVFPGGSLRRTMFPELCDGLHNFGPIDHTSALMALPPICFGYVAKSLKEGTPDGAVELCMTHHMHDTGGGDGADEVDTFDNGHDTDQDKVTSPRRVRPAEMDCDGLILDLDNTVMRVMRHAHDAREDDTGANGEAAVGSVMHRRRRKATGSCAWQARQDAPSSEDSVEQPPMGRPL